MSTAFPTLRGLLVATTALIAAEVAIAADEVPFTQAQIEALGVELAAPVRTETTTGHTYPARVALPPEQERVLTAGQGGVIEAVLTAEGQSVTSGQPLIRVRSAGLAELERNLLQALEQTRLAEQQLERDEALFREGIIPERRVQESRAARAERTAALTEARRALEVNGLLPEEIRALENQRQMSSVQVLKAPFAGSVLEVMVVAGERVEPTAPLLRLGQLTPLWLEVRIPVETVATVAPGTGIRVEGLDLTGRVILVGRRVDAADQSVVVRAEITEGADALSPGQLVQVSLIRSGAGPAFRLPAAAVIRKGEGSYVFVRTQDSFRVEPVIVLSSAARETTVSGALSPDDRVAVRGVAAIKAAWLGIGGE